VDLLEAVCYVKTNKVQAGKHKLKDEKEKRSTAKKLLKKGFKKLKCKDG
jgi:hypothetical protein